MKKRPWLGVALAGLAAGSVTGLFGAGGGMVLVPLLGLLTDIEETSVFPASISIILPICLVSLLTGSAFSGETLVTALPYMLGSAAGGVLAGLLGKRISVKWLHRILGIMILWGGVRYLC